MTQPHSPRISRFAGWLLGWCAALPTASHATGVESIFATARAYTVEVNGNIPAAFDEDQGGAGSGTGFLVDAGRGWILTNAHVAGRSPGELEIRWPDGSRSPAQTLYVDAHVDAAIIAVDPALTRQHAAARLACGPAPAAGHPVGVLGHPIGFRYNASRGIVSGATSRFGQDLIPMDAAVNPGNSGGPVLSLESGEVIGIATANLNSDEVHGITLAVPIRFPCRLLELLRQGQDPSVFDSRLSFAMNQDGEMTLTVASNRLPPGSLPLLPGDEVIAVGKPSVRIGTYTELVDALRGAGSGTAVVVKRQGVEKTLQGALPASPAITRRRGLVLSGALLAPATPDFAAWWLSQGPVLSIQDVAGGSAAESAGFGYGDVIIRMDGEAVTDLSRALELAKRAAAQERPLEILLLRLSDEDNDRKSTFRLLTLEAPETEIIGPPAP